MGSKPTTSGRARRTHSLGGCATCRRRHVKCDQVQPLCLTCKAVGVTCEGYASTVQWMTPSTSSGRIRARRSDANTTRRHLYTEKSRASMSTELTATLPSHSVDASLTEIDSWSKTNTSSNLNSDAIAVGPFGVLNFNSTASALTEQSEAVVTQDSEPEPPEELFPTPSTLDPLMSLDDSLQWADLFALDFSNEYLMQQDPFGPIAQDLLPQYQFGSDQQANWDNSAQSVGTFHNNAQIGLGVLLAPVSPLIDTSAPSTDLLGDTHFLLRHFQDKTIDAMAAVPWTEKSPWKSCHLSNAVQTLADMTYLGEKTVKHANASNLYSLVSCAARHVVNVSSTSTPGTTNRLEQVADWALDKAKLHLEQSLRMEFQGSSKAKYKDQLMATMSAMAASQIAGQQADARRYLLECERVLRLRGLAKREISRKARILHHIYTWARIVGESTYVIHDYNNYAPVVQNLGLQYQRRATQAGETEKVVAQPNATNSHSSRLDDFLRLESQHDSDLEIDEPKEAEKALHDIHLEDARDWTNSMYLQIYGIPETWLSLVSQTTRLANVMDTLKVSDKETNVAFQNALQKRAGRLENMICSFAFRTSSPGATGGAQETGAAGAASTLPNQHMVQALNSALVIFFYRRVRDVNPWILQSHVDDVIRALRDYDDALVVSNIPGPGTAWPAFMAGCEAINSQRRDTLMKWIHNGRAKSGMQSFKIAEEVMTEVWKRRDEANAGPSPRTARPTGTSGSTGRAPQRPWSWVDVSKDKKVWLMLS